MGDISSRRSSILSIKGKFKQRAITIHVRRCCVLARSQGRLYDADILYVGVYTVVLSHGLERQTPLPTDNEDSGCVCFSFFGVAQSRAVAYNVQILTSSSPP